MTWMVTALELVADYPHAQDELAQTIRAAKRQFPGLQRVTLLRDSSRPNDYLILSEWDGHESLAEAVRSGLLWVHRGWTVAWAVSPMRVYDELIDIGE